jgi:hypothetical protein
MQVLAARLPGWKPLAVGLTAILLAALSAFALQRELAKHAPQEPSAAAAFTGGLALHEGQSALSPEEEAFAAALWPIHSEVKLAAVRMIFAGIKYKTDQPDAQTLKATVAPLTQTFRDATARAQRLQPPAELADEHQSYLTALDLYAQAVHEMLKAGDGGDEHLIEAQRRSESASMELLKLSDALWPGEYKPN